LCLLTKPLARVFQDKRTHKSDSQREREARRKEHNQRVIAEQNKKHRSSKSKSPKPPPPSDDKGGSKFQALFAKRSEGFLIDLNFRNAAPRPPVGPCFVGLGLDGELNDKWTKYKANNAVESNYSWKLHAEPDLGVPLAPSAMDLEGCYVDPSKASKTQKMDAYDELFDEDETDEKKENKGPAPLHPDDEALINWKGYAGDTAAEELQERRDTARTEARLQGTKSGKRTMSSGPQEQIALVKRTIGFQSRVLDEEHTFFMKQTTYLANDINSVHGTFKSLAATKAKAAADTEQKLRENKIKLSDEDAIQQSFEVANKSSVKLVHPVKKSVDAVCEIPLFPDDITWGHTFTHVVLDNLPKMDSNRSITANQLGSAYIGDVSKGTQNLRMECNLLVTENNDNIDEGPPSEQMYNAIQKYDLDVNHLREENAPHVNFLFMLDEEKMVASYHPISSRVQLSTGRPANQEITTRFVTKREMNEEEVTALEKVVAEVDADMAKKHPEDAENVSATDNEEISVPKRQNPFAAVGGDSSDSEDEKDF
jgi:hypothetical protein